MESPAKFPADFRLNRTADEVLSLLRAAQDVIYSEPAALGLPPGATAALVENLRARISVAVGQYVVRLNQAGFTQSDHLYKIRDELAAARPIPADELAWLSGTLENGLSA